MCVLFFKFRRFADNAGANCDIILIMSDTLQRVQDIMAEIAEQQRQEDARAAEFRRQYDAERKAARERHDAERKAARERHDAEMAELNRQIAERDEQRKQKFDAEMDEIKQGLAQTQQTLKNISQERGKYDAERKAARERHDAEREEFQRQYDAEIKKSRERHDADMAEIRQTLKNISQERGKYDAEREEFQRQYDAEIKKSRERHDADMAEIRQTLKSVSQEWGNFGNNEGERIEEEFFAALNESKSINGMRLDTILQRLKSRYEYDLVGVNGTAVFVGEIKRRLSGGDVYRFAQNRLPHFATYFSYYANKRQIYGMIGGLQIMPDAVAAAEECGLFVLRLKNKSLIVENNATARPLN